MTHWQPNRRQMMEAGLAASVLSALPATAIAAPPAKGRLIEHSAIPSALVDPRNVTVWLPDGYDGNIVRYPVIYMHDGQNLFDDTGANFGVEWGIDEHISSLAATGKARPAIIVGIWSTPKRFREYGPAGILQELPEKTATQISAKYGGDDLSDDYLRFVVSELKPLIDNTYRTMSGPANTSIMGSSMGGLISLYAMTSYPQIFGAAACLSTHLPLMPFDPDKDAALVKLLSPDIKRALRRFIAGALPKPGRNRLYMDHGTLHLDQFYPPFQAVVDRAVLVKGYRRDHDFVSLPFPGTTHNELAWRERAALPLTFLLGKPR